MYFFPQLYKGTLIKRYKRFFADIQTENGDVITAHNPNTGSMKSLLNNGEIPVNNICLYSKSERPGRKLPYTLELINVRGEWIVSNTIVVNKIVESALYAGEITGIQPGMKIKREYKYKDSRIDFYIENTLPYLIEVKSVTFFDEECCYFPDAVTERGLKHLNTLSNALKEGYKSMMLYVCMVQRSFFKPAIKIDPAYNEAYLKAKNAGVEIKAVYCKYDEFNNCCEIQPFEISCS